jgi:hypothetical protein
MSSHTTPTSSHPVVGRKTSKTSQGHRGVRVRYVAIASIAIIVSVRLLSGGDSRVATEFEFTGGPQDYVVPAGICRIRVEAVGAAGGPAGTAGTPGAGAHAVAAFAVRPGESLRVDVGGWGGAAVGQTPGAGGWNGGGDGGSAFGHRDGRPGKAGSGGGGATDVRRAGSGLEHRIIVAPGGSGGAGGAIRGPLGTGGGDGGGLTGVDGFAPLGSANRAKGGEGGTQTSGGGPGRNAPRLTVTATAGALGVGGNGAAGAASGGGGGGGGLYGGGGGGSSRSYSGGHGGGGSGFGPAGTTFRTGAGGGDGRATVSYDPERDACSSVRARPTGR